MSLSAELVLNFHHSLGTISPLIYGHFSEHIGGVFYDGLWVGEDSPVENIRGFRKALVESFRKIHPPVLRWPGGCFAETYDWRDGIGPRDKRPTRANWWYAWDGRLEPNAVGTHEFMDFCDMVGAKPYVAANMTTLRPLDIRDWIEYCNFPEGSTTYAKERSENGHPAPFGVEYWGIGNENWGDGGHMTPEMYMREFIRYRSIFRSINKPEHKWIFCGANGHDIAWTRRTMQEWRTQFPEGAPAWGVAIHYYCGTAGNPQDFTEEQWYELLHKASFMRRIIDDHRAAMDEFDPDREVGMVIDEWGCWHRDGTGPSHGYNLFEQQSSMRDAVVAALTLNLFNNRCHVVRMANVAQLCNNLHSLYLAGGENFVETPNYHVFDMFKHHQDARQVDSILHCPVRENEQGEALDMLSASASEKDGMITLTLANLHMKEAQTLKLSAIGAKLGGTAEMTVLRHDDVHACNTFEDPFAVVPTTETIALGDTVEVPAASVVLLRIPKA